MRARKLLSVPSSPGLQLVAQRPSLATMGNVVALEQENDVWTLRLEAVARQRDREAYAELFHYFAPRLKSFALSSPGMSSNALAEELVQEVMLKIWTRASTFDAAKASATTWIYTLARNCRIDLLLSLIHI